MNAGRRVPRGAALRNPWVERPVYLLAAVLMICGAPRAMALTCPSGSYALSMYYRGVLEDPSHCADSHADPMFVRYFSNVVSNKQLNYSDTPFMRLETFRNDLMAKGALFLSTHGGGGTVALEFFDTPTARDARYLVYLSDGYTTEEIYKNVVEGTNIPLIAVTEYGITTRLRVMSGTSVILGDYCSAMYAGASTWNVTAFAGLKDASCQTTCVDAKTICDRLACQQLCLKNTIEDAVDGYSGGNYLCSFVGPVESWDRDGVGDMAMSCTRGCSFLAATFLNVGVQDGTAILETWSERDNSEFVLRGYTTAASYPDSPDTLAAFTGTGGVGIATPYEVAIEPGHQWYEWVERDAFGAVSASGLFPPGSLPPDWPARLSEGAVNTSAQLTAELLDNWEEQFQTFVPPPDWLDSTFCADAVIYSIADSLADPVVSQVRAARPDWRVRKLIAPPLGPGGYQRDTTALACRNAIASVVDYNKAWNFVCSELPGCLRMFPVNPGPELYIVGKDKHPQFVGQVAYSDTVGGCVDGLCVSDVLIYDLNDDGLPDGPISRIPATTVGEVNMACGAASEWNGGVNVDPSGRMVVCVGPEEGRLLEEAIAEGRSGLVACGGHIEAELRYHEHTPPLDPNGRYGLFLNYSNVGLKELFGVGHFSSIKSYPGDFVPNDVATMTRKQRIVQWLPGCNMHYWRFMSSSGVLLGPEPTARKLMLENGLSRTLAAASVSNISGGWDKDHQMLGKVLMEQRQLGASNAQPRSVARTMYDAIQAAVEGYPWLKTAAATTSAWGGYVFANRVVPVAVTDAMAEAGRTSAALSWTEPQQTFGNAEAYEIRYRAHIPLTEETFTAGTPFANPPTPGPGGTPHCIELTGLGSCRPYYFAMRTRKNGVWSAISNVATASTTCSGFTFAICDGGGLLAGGGGEEGGRSAELAAEAFAPARTEPAENSFLWGGVSLNVTDLQRIGSTRNHEGVYRVRVREVEQRRTELDQLRLGAVDHLSTQIAVAGVGHVLVGEIGSVANVVRESGREISGELVDLMPGGAPYAGQPGEALLVDMGSTTNQALLVESRGPLAGARSDSIGILVQRPGPSGWLTVATIYPRREFDRMAIPASGSQAMRIVFMRGYVLKSLQKLEGAELGSVIPLAMVGADHSRLGTVSTAVRDSGGSRITVVPGEALSLDFTLSEIPESKVRSLFLEARGSYVSIWGEDQPIDYQAGASGSKDVVLHFALGSAFPNPSDGTVTIGYALARQVPTLLRVYSVTGRVVRTLVDKEQGAGQQEALWDGRDNGGRKVPSGVYFYRLQAGDWHSERRLIVLK